MDKQYTQAFKNKLIEDYFTSNLYFKAYASQVSIPAGTLRGWLRQDKRYKTYTPTDDGSFALTESYLYYLYQGVCDMRKSFNALSGLIVSQMKGNPTNGDAYIFINKRRNQIKILRWETGGFILYYKRLEQGTFEIPIYDEDKKSYKMYYSDLLLMIEGISFKNIRKRKRYLR